MRSIYLVIFCMSLLTIQAQNTTKFTDEENVLKVIESFNWFEMMGDTNLQSIYLDPSFEASLLAYNEKELMRSQDFQQLKNKQYNYVPQINLRANFATTYAFFTAFDSLGKKKCGTEYFHLTNNGHHWKIVEYTQTIFQDCKSIKSQESEIQDINKRLDEWHGLAAVGDSAYFDFFTEVSFYLGTDPKEVWSLKEFKDFAMPHFRKGSAWSFKRKHRNVYLGDYDHYAWFDEILDTWMGLCRGTGVMVKQSNGWKLQHYSLTVLVPNNKINQYIKIIQKD